MNDKSSLYIVIIFLVILNVLTVFMFWGGWSMDPFSMMGPGYMMNDWDDHNHRTNEFSTWKEMRDHMEEEHGERGVENQEATSDRPFAETHKKTYDFGEVKKSSGVVSTTFEIENHGKGTLIIGDISTSCGCTSAEIDKKQLGFNEKAKLTVHFDPDFHKEPLGKITRSVFVKTNDPDLPEMQFDIFVEISE